MKLQVTQEKLNKALSSVSRVASTRGTLPVLANILIKTDNNRLSLSATNLDIGITHYIGAKIEKEGSITVPARLMQDFVGSLPSGTIDLELNGNKLHVSTDKYNSLINGISAEDFPVMPEISKGKTWKMPGALFKKALSQVAFAASSDDMRPVLTGVLFQTISGVLYIAATDSYRLTEKRIGENTDDIKLLIPAVAMNDLLRVLGDGEDEVVVTYDDTQVLFQVGDVELVTRLLEGNYPNYQALIPTSFSVSATLKKADLLNVTKVSSLFARESAGSITIEVDSAKQALSVRSVASQLGENTAVADAKVDGAGSITLNSRYLLDALNAVDGDEVTFGINGKLEPTLLTSAGANPDYRHVVMPLKS